MTLKQLTLLAVAAVLGFSAAKAEIPTGYYNSINGKADAELKTAIHNLVRNFTQVSSYQALPQYFRRTDVHPETNRWWEMYSDLPLYAPSFQGLNREHSFPKSWWGGTSTVSAYVDLNHLYPSEMAANMAKSNYPLGTVNRSQNIKFENGVTTVGYPVAGQGGGAQFVFEPDDEYKGDFARTYFYMATCYQNLTWKYFYMVSQNTYPTLTTWAVNLLLKWHREDPVSEKELLRNEAVYKIQNNRNPFIDYPELAEYIWGNKVGMTFNTSAASQPSGTPNLITPVQDMDLDFGQVAIGKSVQARLWFKGEYLSQPVNLVVYTGNKDYFTIPSRSISANLINADDGYWLTMTYTPDSIGQHTSRLLIQGGGVAGSRGIELRGECLSVPTLTAPTATDATNVTSTSYIANWKPVDGEEIDYYIINRTRYVNGTATSEQIVAEGPGIEINDFDKSDSETYTVQSVRLGYTSPESNVISVKYTDAVNGIYADDMPLAVDPIPGGIRFHTGTPHTGVTIVDATGRTARVLDTVSDYTEVYLPAGIYLVTSQQCLRPIKAVVK